MLAILNGLSSRSLGDGQWNAFLCRLVNEESAWGKRRLGQSGDGASQDLDSGGTGHLMAL